MPAVHEELSWGASWKTLMYSQSLKSLHSTLLDLAGLAKKSPRAASYATFVENIEL